MSVVVLTFFVNNGRIADCDMVFNDRDFNFSTNQSSGTMDLQNITAHEAGHVIGISHTSVVGATMFPFAEIQETVRRDIAQDDVQAAIAIYDRVSSAPSATSANSSSV